MSRRGGGSQAGRRWPGHVAARATEQLRGEGEEDDRGRSGGGLGRLEELGQVSGRQVGGPGGLLSLSISVFISLFYFCNLFLI